MNYVLIYAIFAFHSVTTGTTYFASEDQCKIAGEAIEKKFSGAIDTTVKWHCAGASRAAFEAAELEAPKRFTKPERGK